MTDDELLDWRKSGFVRILEGDGLRFLSHRRVPVNNGGLALGQVVLAAVSQLGGAMPGLLHEFRVWAGRPPAQGRNDFGGTIGNSDVSNHLVQ